MRRQGPADLFDWRIDRRATTPLFRQLYLQARAAILSQALPPGAKLPATRALALHLGVARSSVVAAYEQLLAEGYATGHIGAGTFVASDLPNRLEQRKQAPAKPPAITPLVDFAASTAQNDERPFNTGRTLVDARTAEVWRRLSHQAARMFGPDHLGYGDPCGLPALRQQICDYLRAARGVRCMPAQIIVTAGTQHAIDIAARVLLRPGYRAWVEDPGYPLTRDALAAQSVTLQPVPVDGQGLDVTAGIRLAPRAAAAFVTPSHQFPTGVALSMARRLQLLAWARASGAWIIEDDYVSEFRYDGRPLASLQGLDDAGRVIYVGTLNKALFPGLRLGYAVVPPALLPAFVGARYLMDRQPPSFAQAVTAAFMQQGYFFSHIRRMRLQYREQRDALVAALARHAGDHLTVDVPDQGMHLVAYLKPRLSDVAIEQAARERGIVVRAMSRLYQRSPPRPALMLGFSGYPRSMIVPAAVRLARIVDEQAAKRRRRA